MNNTRKIKKLVWDNIRDADVLMLKYMVPIFPINPEHRTMIDGSLTIIWGVIDALQYEAMITIGTGEDVITKETSNELL